MSSASDFVYKIKADFLKALANPVRLKIIEYLKDKEASVSQMVKALDIEQSSLSKHLSVLKQVGVLQSRQEKATVYYSILEKEIFRFLRPVAELLRRRLKQGQSLLDHLGKEE